MYKIIYKDPQTENKKQLFLSDEGGRSIEKIVTDKNISSQEFINLHKVGLIKKSYILSISEIQNDPGFKEEKEVREEDLPTRYVTNPPTQKEWDCITIGVLYKYPRLVPIMPKEKLKEVDGFESVQNLLPPVLNKLFYSLCLSVWNWNNKKTNEIISIGKQLKAEGETFKSVLSNISKG